MIFSRRIIAAFAALPALLAEAVLAQTYSSCNPLNSGSCPADTALGTSINVDFTKGAVNSFLASGTPSYGSGGVSFTVAKAGDSPQLNSVFYIMFGRVEITMKAAPGAGIVSSLVLQSDDLDEIDFEWLGADGSEVQSNYFGKGVTGTYNRAQFHPAPNNQASNTYTVDWTQDRIQWAVGGTVVRTLTPGNAEANQYPQTPMQVKFGAWSGGDPSNSAGTIEWARGPTDFSKGPFTMVVSSVAITDYSTGKQYKYSDTSGTWQSIQAIGGAVNGNAAAEAQLSVTASAAAAGTAPPASVPAGIGKGGSAASATETGLPWVSGSPTSGAVPSGWTINPNGKIVPSAAPAPRTGLVACAATALLVWTFAVVRRWW